MTLREITDRLRAAGVPDADFDGLILASLFTGRSRASLMADRDADLLSPELRRAVERRERREPLQYIVGEWEFMGLPFEVGPACLIPRQDTELLCRVAIDLLPAGGRMLDMCTGSGCVAVAAAVLRPDARVSAADKYRDALDAAKLNCEKNGVADRVELFVHDVTKPLPTDVGLFDVIASNPPYIPADELEKLEPELSFEPRFALTDGGDGLSLIKAVFENCSPALTENGSIAVEHGADQGEAVRRIALEAGLVPRTLRDLGGRERVTAAAKK
jgi:release factor glutamine methyltransferase